MAPIAGALANKTVLITGAAGGLGKAIAIACLLAGANVVACDINAFLLKQCEAEIGRMGQHCGAGFLAITADVSSEESAAQAVDAAVDRFGALDVLVNNAGVMDRFDGVADLEVELWNRVLAINLTGPFLMSRVAVKHFLERERPGGSIVNVGSASSVRGGAAGAAYTASKHGLLGLTKNTAANYMKKGIRCNILLPGGMHTNITDAMQNGVNEDGYGIMQRVMAVDPGMVDLQSIANTAVHLASDASAALNGAVISADNGWSAF